jgi:hypothetical protein
MGDYANTLVLAWPYPGEHALPEALRDLLAAESWLPDLDEPVADIEDDDSVVLAGDEHSGPILAISDTEANDGTAGFSDVIALLTTAGLSVYAANQAGDNYPAWNVYHLVGEDGDVSVEHRGMVDGAIVLSADDITGHGEYVGMLHDFELAERTRRLLDHPHGMPAAVRALAWATGPRVPRDGREG